MKVLGIFSAMEAKSSELLADAPGGWCGERYQLSAAHMRVLTLVYSLFNIAYP